MVNGHVIWKGWAVLAIFLTCGAVFLFSMLFLFCLRRKKVQWRYKSECTWDTILKYKKKRESCGSQWNCSGKWTCEEPAATLVAGWGDVCVQRSSRRGEVWFSSSFLPVFEYQDSLPCFWGDKWGNYKKVYSVFCFWFIVLCVFCLFITFICKVLSESLLLVHRVKH